MELGKRQLVKRHAPSQRFGLKHSTQGVPDGASIFSKKLSMLLLAFTSMNRASFGRGQTGGSRTAVQRNSQRGDVAMIEQAKFASWPIADVSDCKSFLQGKGLHFPAEDIDGTSTSKTCLSDAVVKLVTPQKFMGSGSFVAAKGLILTNHHVVDLVQVSDTQKEGFVAKTLADEIPTQFEAWITRSSVDVSERFVHSVAESDPLKRMEAIKLREQEIVNEAEAAASGSGSSIYCEVVRMWPKRTYVLITYERLKDVRLVYLPPFRVASAEATYLAADIALLRAYVAPDGSFAEYSPNNVPYSPAKFFNLSPDGVKEGDFVFTLGYPGFSSRYSPSSELAYIMEASVEKSAVCYMRRLEEDRLCSAKPEAKTLLNKLKAVYEGPQPPAAHQPQGSSDELLMAQMLQGRSLTEELLELSGSGDLTPDFNGCLRFSVGEVTSVATHMKPPLVNGLDMTFLGSLWIFLNSALGLLLIWCALKFRMEVGDFLPLLVSYILFITVPIAVLRAAGVDPSSFFALPSEVLEVCSKDEVKKTPVLLRSSLDIAGGASGSPIMDAHGQLVAVVNCGSGRSKNNYQRPDYTDGVDLRYALMIIGEYSGARWLVEEMASPD